jgi:16S rRNA (adenine1518-N6/adenine1519-N6)-dimethyltransferase
VTDRDEHDAWVDSRTLLRQASLHPKKSFGQNFLVAEHVVRSIARACVPDGEVGAARVVELGAGLGALTSLLAARARRVVAVERDRDLVPLLAAHLAPAVTRGALEIVEADAQTVDVAALLGPDEPGSPRVLCGNLPYQITGRLLSLATMQAAAIDRVVFMVQDEVADRLVAAPGTKTYGALTVFTRAAFDVSRLLTVSRGSFHPPPEVTSSVVVLVPRRPPLAVETETFRAVVKGAFATRRKTLRNAWSSLLPSEALARAAAEARVSLDARGETLAVEDFARMTAAVDDARAAAR